MNQPRASTNEMLERDEIGLVELLIIIARRKKLVVGFPMIVALVAIAISLILPNVYSASVKLLPPQQAQSGAAALLSQLGGMAGAAAGVTGLKNPNDLYIGMLKSRTIADRLIDKFDLKRVYNTDSREKARKALELDTVINAGKDGIIAIAVESESQKLVAPLANAYVEELVKLTGVLAVTEAAQRRVFYEKQLEQAKNNLATAESNLKGSMEARGVISVDSESRAILETVGRLRAQISAKEIELSSMKAFVTANHPSFVRAQEELSSLNAQLSTLENGRPGAPVGNTAQKDGLESIKILRDVKYHQMLYELLAKQYEIARLDEAKDASMIQVLDAASEPERKIKPKRALIVAGWTVFAFICAVIWICMGALRQRSLRFPERQAQWIELRRLMRFSSRN